MKQIITIVILLLLVSCDTKKKTIEDIDVKNLKTACDCLDATEIIFDEANDFVERNGGSFSALDSSQQEKLKYYYHKKEREVMEYCKNNLNVKNKDFPACTGFFKALEKSKVYRRHLLEYHKKRLIQEMEEKKDSLETNSSY